MIKHAGDYNLLLILAFLFLPEFTRELMADTIYLKNKRNIEGFIINEDERSVELEIRIGMIKFDKREIERIYKSNPAESEEILREWERERLEAQEELIAEERRKKELPKQAKFTKEAEGLVIEAVINNKFKTALILDTGASLTVLTNKMAKKIGITPDKKSKKVNLIIADGKKIEARHCILESVKVQDMEAKNVEAAVITDESVDNSFLKDGLLGMSFLSRFNLKIDNGNKHLILEEIK